MPYYWDDQQKISLPVPAGGVPGGGGGGLFGGLMGGSGGTVPGLLSGGGTDQLMEALVRRQLEQSLRPDFGKMAAAFAQAAMPSRLPVPMGAALGMAAGALSAGDDNGAKALQALKMLEDLRLNRRKQGWIEKFLQDESSGSDPAKDILNPTGIPGVKPLSSTAPPAGTPLGAGGKPIAPVMPRVTGTDETTGDLSATYGEPPAGDAAGGDSDLTAGAPVPRSQAATRLPVVPAAYSPGSAGKERFLTLASQFESNNRNVPNYRYDAGHTAGGYFQITDPTWRDFAPPEVQAQYPRAMDAPFEVQKAVAHNIPPQRWTNNNPKLAAALPAAGLPPPRMPAESWLNQPPTNSGFRDPSFAPGNQAALERFRGSVLGTLAGGDPLVNPDQSPTAAVRGGGPPDEVIPSGRPSIPGLLRTQYTGQVNPDQSPSIQMGGQPMPAVPQPQAPAGAPPMAPGPVQVPSVPTPPNLDPTRLQGYMLDLARKSAMAEALGLPNIYGPKLQVLQNSPQYKAMQEWAAKNATLPLEYASPQYNVDVQSRLETAKQQIQQLSKYLGPEYDPIVQNMLEQIKQAAILEREKAKTRFDVDPNAIGTPTAPQQTGPGYTEARPTQRGTIIPPLTEAAPIVGSPKELEQRQTGKGGWAETQSEWNNNLTALRKVQQTALAVADVMKSYQTGSFAGELSDIRAKLKAVGIHLPESIAGDPAAAQKIIKDNFSQTITSLKGFDSNPAVYQIKLAFENWANTNLQPEANLSILSKAVGTSEWQEQMVHDFAEAKRYGWRDPQDFMRVWGAKPENSLQAFIDRASQKIGPLAGAPQSPRGETPATPAGPRLQSKEVGGKTYYRYQNGWFDN